MKSPRPECIRLRGARQNNLKGFDLDVPLGRFIAVTGLSGAGKSSLVFDTLHAEGQRRYVETFSAYTRQFLDLLSKPDVDAIENIRPSIAIEQKNTVKTSRSTVGTMTELTDFAKVWFSHVAECFDPETGAKVEDDNPQTVWAKMSASHPGSAAIVAFKVVRPANLAWTEILGNLKGQSYLRVLVPGPSSTLEPRRIDDLVADPSPLAHSDHLYVTQDRVSLSPAQKSRFIEAVEAAMHFGRGEVRLFSSPEHTEMGHFSRGLHSPKTGRSFRPATPPLFSFNSPLGACPACRGFGRVIHVDFRLALPDQSLSIEEGVIRCWESEIYGESKQDLLKAARKRKIRTDVPFAQLPPEHQAFVIDGEEGYGEENGRTWPKYWYGVKGFFRWLEKNTYKMHVRVFLSRYRVYDPCPDCGGTRLQPEALCWKWHGRTLPGLYQLSVRDLLALLTDTAKGAPSPRAPGSRSEPSQIAYDSMVTRLRYLEQVGLDYLTLDRSSRTLSGGEVQRVNLTSCLGTSLVDTLFVLDEPSVGLHPRDIDRLIAIVRSLVDAGNTVVVVEHDEAMIRAADHVIEVGPEPGSRGGNIVFEGTVGSMLRSPTSITGAYFSGRKTIETPPRRRPVSKSANSADRLRFRDVSKHNLSKISFSIPLRRLVCLSGVSGSGKSTLLDNAIHQGLLARRLKLMPDAAEIGSIEGAGAFGEVVMVDQSPLSRTPRSNPALYVDAWEPIRALFASTPAAQEAGMTSSTFSFNGGDGRCDHCLGLGYERVEMQFLSDVFVPCPVCDGKRFKPEVLSIRWNGLTVAELLATSIGDALGRFEGHPGIHRRLSSLESLGLGYLTLGQPLNTLSGGESQRLKLVGYLGEIGGAKPAIGDPESESGGGSPATAGTSNLVEQDPAAASAALLLLDEPTTGLHRHDVKRLIGVLQALVERGHSVVVIEHNLDVLKSADWILEIGPGAGSDGGRIVAQGTPEDIARATTATSPFLRASLGECNALRDIQPATGLLAAEEASPFNGHGVAGGAGGGALVVTGARENNLKGITLEIPHGKLTVVTGVSGSGKSTLAFDIVFAEGQRRFMESMSPYARQFVEQLPRPDVDRITGIPPTVAIEQRVTRGTRKSTVATITEVAQYLRLLYARVGVQHHPDTDRPVTPLSAGALRKLLRSVVQSPRGRKARHLYLCAPLIRGRKGHHQPIVDWMAGHGYSKLRADGRIGAVAAFKKLDRYSEHDIEVVVADMSAQASPAVPAPTAKLRETNAGDSLDEALRLGKGSCFLADQTGAILSWFSTTRTDAKTGESFPELDPKQFSFNSPRGWCPACRGHGWIFPWMLEPEDEQEDDPMARLREFGLEAGDVTDSGRPCPECGGARLNRVSRAVKLHLRGRGRPALSLPALLHSTPSQLLARLAALDLDRRGRLIAADIVNQIRERLAFLEHVGLGYLEMERPTATLSGGESQRIRLASQLGSNLSGALYVLDEPSIGLHARDNERLIATLQELRDKGNTLLVVEHDDELMERADHIIDLGPAAGRHGGELLASGTPAQIKRSSRSLTGLFLSKGIPHPLRGAYRPLGGVRGWIELEGANFRNLKDVSLRIPTGRLTLVAGPSGAGKSTLFRDLLAAGVGRAIREGKARLSGREFARRGGFASDHAAGSGAGSAPPFKSLRGAGQFKSVIEVDQFPIGKTPRSTPATYLGIFDLIRTFFSTLPESKLRGYTASRFSFNTGKSRCPACDGAGRIKLEMAFMPDTYLPCDDCRGARYGPELADITWKGRTIGEVLQLTFEDAVAFFDFHSQLSQVCRLMVECGLGYLTLGQSSPTLSGGEAQRLKLATELSRGLASYRERSRGEAPRHLYLLEEPTIGLHSSDCEKLIGVLHALVDQGHTVIVIEHHLDLLAEADYIVELGPDGGPGGGKLIYQGEFAGLLKNKSSPTAPFLRRLIRRGRTKRSTRRESPS